MKEKKMLMGPLLLAGFGIWTVLIQTVDVQPIGPQRSVVGFAMSNGWFHRLTGVHWELYTLTDWLGLVPIAVCLFFGGVGLAQLLRRKSLRKVDMDILLLGVYYGVVVIAYLFFEEAPVNYRPVLVAGVLEASYPSSTTLLVLSVLPTLYFQAKRRCLALVVRKTVCTFSVLFSAFMVTGRLVSGVHWLTDIIGAVLLSSGLFLSYRAGVLWWDKRKAEEAKWN